MTIRRERKKEGPLTGDLPSAKLYLDDIQAIVAALTSPSGTAPSHFSISYSIGELTCDTIEDLQRVGGRTARFRIDVTETPGELGIPSDARSLHSYLQILSVSSYLILDCSSESEFWMKRGKVREIFQANSIWWKRSVHALVEAIPWWIVGLFALMLVAFNVSGSPLRQEFGLNFHDVIVMAPVGFFMYLCLFRHSVVILRYSHEGGIRSWLRTHSTQIFFLVMAALLGALAKGILDHLWRPALRPPSACDANIYANKNSLVRNSLIVSLSFAAFSNSNRLAASRMSLSSLTTYASNSGCDLNSGMPSASPPVRSV